MASARQYQVVCAALLLILGALATLAASRSVPEGPSMQERHEQWMTQYGRVYKDASERQKRFEIFKENVERIDSFNRGNEKPYRLGVNQFADLTNEEFKATRNGFKSHMCSTDGASFKYENITSVPSTVDWRKKGAVTPIKDQGQCGIYPQKLIVYANT